MAAIRDANRSAFAVILEDLLKGLPGAYAAAFVDDEGECVEYAGEVDPFHVKVAGAHLRVVLATLESARSLGGTRWFVVRGSLESLSVYCVDELYALVILSSRGAGFAHTPRALASALRRFAEEGGFSFPGERWYPANFTFDAKGRPSTWHDADGLSEPIEIVGSLVGLGRRERGYRLRLSGGAEVTAVREQSGVWYTDDAFALTPRANEVPEK